MREVHFNFGHIRTIVFAPADVSDEEIVETLVEDLLEAMTSTNVFPEAEECLAAIAAL